MTDRPTHPLTKEQYELIVVEAGMRLDTAEFFRENYDLLNTTTHKMAIDAACNTAWGGNLRTWTDDGKRAIGHRNLYKVVAIASNRRDNPSTADPRKVGGGESLRT